MGKTQLILDAGGVVISNFPHSFWTGLAEQAEASVEQLQRFFHDELKEPLWTGKISEPEFWNRIGNRYPKVDLERARTDFLSGLRLLPTAARLPEWSTRFDLHLLSNHRPEWLLEVIRPFISCFSTMTISSETGVCKPNREIFERVQAKLPPGEPVIFVDDQEKNLVPARTLGWQTILADEEGRWIETLLEG